MSTLVEKWSDIIAEADINSAEDLQTLYWNEVYSKIDPEQYGN